MYVYISLICSTLYTDFGIKVKDETWKCIYKMQKHKYRNNALFFLIIFISPMFELYNLHRNDQHRTPKLEDNFLNSYLVNFSSFYRRSQNWTIVSNCSSCYDPIRILRIWQGPKYSLWLNCLSFWLVPSLVMDLPTLANCSRGSGY